MRDSRGVKVDGYNVAQHGEERRQKMTRQGHAAILEEGWLTHRLADRQETARHVAHYGMPRRRATQVA